MQTHGYRLSICPVYFHIVWQRIRTKTAPPGEGNAMCYWWELLSFWEAAGKGRCAQTDLLVAVGVPGDGGLRYSPKPSQKMHANWYEVHSLAFPGAQRKAKTNE